MKDIIVFNGIKFSGKTTLASALAETETGFEFFEEIGGQLRRLVEYDTIESGQEFDRLVVAKEELRDLCLQECPTVPLVETWHTGNLAYILARNPCLFEGCRNMLNERLSLFRILAVLVVIERETFWQRLSGHIPEQKIAEQAEFYDRILSHTRELYDQFGIHYVEIKNDGFKECALDRLKCEVFSFLGRSMR